MDIGIPIRELGAVDVEPLRQAILGLAAEDWLQDQRRQMDAMATTLEVMAKRPRT